MSEKKLIIGITQGDVNGTCYEIILKTLSESHIFELCTPIIYGSSKVLGFYRKNMEIQLGNINVINNPASAINNQINVINCCSDDLKVEIGKSTSESGIAAIQALKKATEDLKNNAIDILITSPICKTNVSDKDFNFANQTEFVASQLGNKKDGLNILINDVLRVASVSDQMPIKNLVESISTEKVLKKIKLLNKALSEDFCIRKPRIAVLSLNPGINENGFGEEEKNIILPAIKSAESEGILAFGPYAADSFFGNSSYKKFDAVLAMYHDQGVAPFKTLCSDNGIQYTAGLSHILTAPINGVDFELAGENQANEESFRNAIYLAYDITNNQKLYNEINQNPLKTTYEEPRQNGRNQIE